MVLPQKAMLQFQKLAEHKDSTNPIALLAQAIQCD
jgi:hypothetical protein